MLLSIPSARGARVLPRKLAFEPTIAPHASDRKSTLPYALSPGLMRIARASSKAIGKSIATVACAGMNTVSSAEVSIIPVARRCGDEPNLERNASAMRLLKPDRMSAAARMNTPSMKNTAELPKAANASLAGIAFVRPSRAMASRPVMPTGSAFVTHRVVQSRNTEKALLPAAESPSGGGTK